MALGAPEVRRLGLGLESAMKRAFLHVQKSWITQERRITHGKVFHTLSAHRCALRGGVQTAVSRAQFEMNCQQVTPTIISREVVQPALQGPWVNGIQRAEYTVGVAGCGKRHTYVVICPDGGEGCFAAGPGRFHPDWQ
jgi:hypothetical protein